MSRVKAQGVQGQLKLPGSVISGAAELAASFSADITKDSIEVYSQPHWLKPIINKFLGHNLYIKLSHTDRDRHLVATMGCVRHIDNWHGNIVMLVLHNEGLKFKQGRSSFAPKAGEWFIFDDRKYHQVIASKAGGAFLGWSIPMFTPGHF